MLHQGCKMSEGIFDLIQHKSPTDYGTEVIQQADHHRTEPESHLCSKDDHSTDGNGFHDVYVRHIIAVTFLIASTSRHSTRKATFLS